MVLRKPRRREIGARFVSLMFPPAATQRQSGNNCLLFNNNEFFKRLGTAHLPWLWRASLRSSLVCCFADDAEFAPLNYSRITATWHGILGTKHRVSYDRVKEECEN